MDSEEALVNIGLSKNEAITYLTLLKIGNTPAGEIAKISKLHRTNVYDALERLIKKGLVAYIVKINIKYYQATDPKNLITLLKEKELELQKLLPRFNLDYEIASKNLDVYMTEGKRAIRDILNKLLEYGKPIYVYGIPKDASAQVGLGFMNEYHEKRAKKKIVMYHIYNEDARERIKHLNSLPYTEAGYLPPEYDSPITTFVCGESVVLALITKNSVMIHLHNPALARAYMKYFDLFWKVAKKG